MSGHSKWSKVKHQKKTTDAAKSSVFTHASRAISIAVREGGGIADPERNIRLRLAIEKAKDVNMPKSTIERAIARASDPHHGAYEQMLYEGYGPNGVAILVDVTTDSRTRTSSALKNIFDQAGGQLVPPGSVSFQFTRNGMVVVKKQGRQYDDIVNAGIVAGAHDVVEQYDTFEVYTNPDQLFAVKKALTESGWCVDSWEMIMRTNAPIHIDENTRTRVGILIARLKEYDDVHHVYSNIA